VTVATKGTYGEQSESFRMVLKAPDPFRRRGPEIDGRRISPEFSAQKHRFRQCNVRLKSFSPNFNSCLAGIPANRDQLSTNIGPAVSEEIKRRELFDNPAGKNLHRVIQSFELRFDSSPVGNVSFNVNDIDKQWRRKVLALRFCVGKMISMSIYFAEQAVPAVVKLGRPATANLVSIQQPSKGGDDLPL